MASLLALVAALDGRLQQAVQRIDEANAPPGEPLGMAVFASAVIACRREKWAEAPKHLELPEYEKLKGPLRGLREALLAWSLERLTGEPRPVEVIPLFGEASPDSLKAAWPELTSFLLNRPRKAG